jgi:hypothetical protein
MQCPARHPEDLVVPADAKTLQLGWHPPAKHLSFEGRIKDRLSNTANFRYIRGRVVSGGMPKGKA